MNSAVFVGMTRFELATSGPPDRCATGLRHIPGVSAPATTDAAMRHKNVSGLPLLRKTTLHVLFRGYDDHYDRCFFTKASAKVLHFFYISKFF